MDYEKDFTDLNVLTSLGNIHLKHHNGSKQKLIFLHGFGINSRAWGRLMSLLPDDLDVYLMDLLGHGGSSAPEIEYRIEKQTEALKEVVDKLGMTDCYMVGHSYGGWAVLLYAANGYAAKGFILEDAAGVKDHMDHLENTEGKEAFKELMFKTAMRYSGNKEHVIRSVLDAEFHNPWFDEKALSVISRNTLIIWGENDKLMDLKSAYTLHKGIKGSVLEIIKGAGHEPHYTNPELTKEALLRFISYG